MTLALHVSDSNDKKVGTSTWVTTSESAKKNTCLYGQAQTRPPLSINNTRLTTAATCTHARAARRVTNKTPPARVATPTWPHAARSLCHIIHDSVLQKWALYKIHLPLSLPFTNWSLLVWCIDCDALRWHLATKRLHGYSFCRETFRDGQWLLDHTR